MSASKNSPDMQSPLFQAFGHMIVEAANREANLRAQLIEAQYRIAELSAEIAKKDTLTDAPSI